MTPPIKGNDQEKVKCPICNQLATYVPPNREVDTKKRVLKVLFRCSNGHEFWKEFDLL